MRRVARAALSINSHRDVSHCGQLNSYLRLDFVSVFVSNRNSDMRRANRAARSLLRSDGPFEALQDVSSKALPNRTATASLASTSSPSLPGASLPSHRPSPSSRGFASSAGQPLPKSHPEIMGPQDLTPGIPRAEYVQRRGQLARHMGPGDVAILSAALQQYVAGIIPHPFRQEADFLYLTGVSQQPAAVVIQSTGPPGDPSHQYFLFVPDYDAQREQWDGATLSPTSAVDDFGADKAHPFSSLANVFDKLAAVAPTILYDTDRTASGAGGLHRSVPGLALALQEGRTRPLRSIMHQLRWVKSPAEVALMRRSAQLAAAGIADCMAHALPGVSEGQLAALFEFKCRIGGAQRQSYPAVVASGADATTIHYSRNDKALRSGDMLLMDAGCELFGYSSDVTRTFPVDGKYSPAQRDLYCAVLEVHRACVAQCVPGASLRDIHHRSVALLSEALRQLGISGSKSAHDIMRAGLYRSFYPHTIGHWLGLDVHDCPSLGHEPRLRPGVILTIEPGLYIPDIDRFGSLKGLGVRIEDDVLVTEEGEPEVLSAGVPVEPGEVERLISSTRLREKSGGGFYF